MLLCCNMLENELRHRGDAVSIAVHCLTPSSYTVQTVRLLPKYRLAQTLGRSGKRLVFLVTRWVSYFRRNGFCRDMLGTQQTRCAIILVRSLNHVSIWGERFAGVVMEKLETTQGARKYSSEPWSGFQAWS